MRDNNLSGTTVSASTKTMTLPLESFAPVLRTFATLCRLSLATVALIACATSAVRHHQAGDGSRLFLNEGTEQGGRGDEFDGPELQHQKSYQPHRSQKDDRSSNLKRAEVLLASPVYSLSDLTHLIRKSPTQTWQSSTHHSFNHQDCINLTFHTP